MDFLRLFRPKQDKEQMSAEGQRNARLAEQNERIRTMQRYEKTYTEIGDRTQFPPSEDQMLRPAYEQFGGSPLENEEYRKYAESLFQILLQKGAILCEGKMFINKAVRIGQDYDLLFTAGKIKDKKVAVNSPSRLLFQQNLLSRLEKPSDSQNLEAGSTISTYTQSIDNARKDIDLPEFWKDMSQDTETENVTYILHQFASGHSSKGRILIKMMYVLPSEIGNVIEQDIDENPWIIEALSELVAKNAGSELAAKNAEDFDFQPNYFNAAGVEMFAPSVSPAPRSLHAYQESE